ncbi:hypothetical protein FH972_008470 [Carpinus fangiana]|uniref:Uncharacterized protein n=1 Tax=Carpinus fangiana TaxID=176857 RepID=A0A5N6QZN4_9ROSI|nr:hypothetical protein FH972_008470 [Carpinus fangiana]
MANKGVALLVVMCLILVAAVKATEVYNPCYSYCSPACITAKKSNSLCEKYCDDECAAVENLSKLGVKFDFEKHSVTGVAGVPVDTSDGVLQGFTLLNA